MNLLQFHSWLEDPLTLDKDSLPVLEALVKEYPWCQHIEVLYLLNLKKENDHRFSRQLRIAAIYSADRSKLRNLLEWIVDPHDAVDSQNELKETFHDRHEGARPANVQEMPVQEEKIQDIERKIQDSLSEIEEKRNRLRLLIEEKRSLLAKDKGLEEAAKEETSLRPLPKDGLLEDFLRQQNIQKKGAFFDPVEKARKSLEDDGQLISETLARLLAAQGKISRAVKIYQQLMVKNPEKSSYFAAQIENLKNKLKE
jgi:hypothetical protein